MPLLAGAFVEDAYQRDQWTPFWLTSAAIMGSSGLIFLIFGDTSRQHFAEEDKKEKLSVDENNNSNSNHNNSNNNNNISNDRKLAQKG